MSQTFSGTVGFPSLSFLDYEPRSSAEQLKYQAAVSTWLTAHDRFPVFAIPLTKVITGQ